MRMCDVLAAVCVLLLMRQHVCMYILNDRARFLAAAAAHPKGADGMAAATLGEMLMQEQAKRQRLDG